MRHFRPPRMESFFHSMKAEAIRGLQFATVAALRSALRRYFHYYNHTRVHSALGYCPLSRARARCDDWQTVNESGARTQARYGGGGFAAAFYEMPLRLNLWR